jgi:hypothetical protein
MARYLLSILLMTMAGCAFGQSSEQWSFGRSSYTAQYVEFRDARSGHVARNYSLSIDKEASNLCRALELDEDSKEVFFVPCASGSTFYAPGWDQERAFSCIHTLLLEINRQVEGVNADIVGIACSENAETGVEP